MNRQSGGRARVTRGHDIQWAFLLRLFLAVCAVAVMPFSAAWAASSNANLSGIGFTQGSMTPAFSPNTLSYDVSLGNSTPSTGIQAFLEDAPLSSMTITTAAGTSTLLSGVIRSIPLDVGPNVVTIRVTAEDNVTTKDYTVTITRAAPPPNLDLSFLSLSSGFLNPGFSSSTLSYAATVGNAVDRANEALGLPGEPRELVEIGAEDPDRQVRGRAPEALVNPHAERRREEHGDAGHAVEALPHVGLDGVQVSRAIRLQYDEHVGDRVRHRIFGPLGAAGAADDVLHFGDFA